MNLGIIVVAIPKRTKHNQQNEKSEMKKVKWKWLNECGTS